jgi:FkbM family methyltransferase
MIITNILNGILKRLRKRSQKPRFTPLSWLTIRILKNEPDQLLKKRQFPHFILNYIRPYEVVKTYKEIFVEEIYRFKAEHDNPVIFDCGANIGISTIYFKTIYPNAVIQAFEPDNSLFEILSKNIHDNGLKNVALHKAAIWTENTTLSFASKGSEGSHIDITGNSENQVQAIQLSGILENLDRIHFLKMDIEGAEYEVIKDCATQLHKIDHLFLEYHGKVNETYKLQELIQIVEKAGFNVYIKMAADQIQSPFYQKKTGTQYDVQLNIFCFK